MDESLGPCFLVPSFGLASPCLLQEMWKDDEGMLSLLFCLSNKYKCIHNVHLCWRNAYFRVGGVAQEIKPLPKVLRSYVGSASFPICIWSYLLLIIRTKQWKEAQILGPCIHVGEVDEELGSWLCLSLPWTLYALREWTEEWKNYLFMSPYLSVCNSFK